MAYKYATVFAAVALTLAAPAFAQDGDTKPATSLESVAPYPAAEAGMLRHVIELPEQDNEDLLHIQVIAGKVMSVECNTMIMSGRMTKETLDGWGYDYLVLDNISEPATTRMACLDDKKEDRFVVLNTGTVSNLRYNSKLPVVVYAPEGIEVKYRIWQTTNDLIDAVVK